MTYSFKKTIVGLSTLSLLVWGFFFITQANHLEVPENVSCTIQLDGDAMPGGQIAFVDWDDLDDADKYSVDAEALYDNGDGTFTEAEWSFGTSDREDGRDISDSDLDIALIDFTFIQDDGSQTPASEIQVKVKGLHPGRGQGRQNNPFSEFVTCSA